MFAEHDLARNIAYSCEDTFALVSLVSAGLGIGFAPQWTKDFANGNFELRKVRGVEFRIGVSSCGAAATSVRQSPALISKPLSERGDDDVA